MDQIRAYTSSEEAFNKPLRRGEFPERCKALVKELQSLPAYQGGPLYRGTRLSRVESITAGELKVGAVLRDPAFFSSSTSLEVAENFQKDALIAIERSWSGRSIEHLTTCSGEEEVLFQPGTMFKVVSVTTFGQDTLIKVEEIAPPPPHRPRKGVVKAAAVAALSLVVAAATAVVVVNHFSTSSEVDADRLPSGLLKVTPMPKGMEPRGVGDCEGYDCF